MYLANALTIFLCVFISPLWHSVICQFDACYFLLAFLFYLGLILNSIANWDFFSNASCQRYQHSAIFWLRQRFETGLAVCGRLVYNPSQNIWHIVKKYNKIGQDFKSVISNFACFLTGTLDIRLCLQPHLTFF